jgi:hypothetical protein
VPGSIASWAHYLAKIAHERLWCLRWSTRIPPRFRPDGQRFLIGKPTRASDDTGIRVVINGLETMMKAAAP